MRGDHRDRWARRCCTKRKEACLAWSGSPLGGEYTPHRRPVPAVLPRRERWIDGFHKPRAAGPPRPAGGPRPQPGERATPSPLARSAPAVPLS